MNMHIQTGNISRAGTPLRWGRWIILAMISGFGVPLTALGQTAAPKPATSLDPLDSMCAQIGRPATVEEVEAFEGFQVLGIQSEYTEVIGAFNETRARSVRYLPDDNRTAQFIFIKTREICFTAPDGDNLTCGVPLLCNSDEADFVLVDENDAPFVVLKKPDAADEGAAPPEKGHDWVEFAGGTIQFTIENDSIGANRATPSMNRKAFDGSAATSCSVGSGHPVLDASFAYSWHTNCQSAYASDTGTVVYLSESGEIGAIPMGPGVGITTRRNRLYWSFPQDEPIEMAVECQTANDVKIPTSADEVARIDVQISVPDSVELSDPIIIDKIGDVAIEYVKEICGVRSPPRQTSFDFEGYIRGAPALFNIRWQRGGLQVSAIPRQYLTRVAAQNRNYQPTWVRRFASFIRSKIEADRTQDMLAEIQSDERLSNIANGMRSADVQTLVALGQGLVTRMPWAEMNPSFADGRFRLTWSISSTDPNLAFFSNRNQTGWQAIRNSMPAGLDRVRLSLTCLLPLSKAQRLEPDMVVDVEATLLSYNSSNQMVFDCSAP